MGGYIAIDAVEKLHKPCRTSPLSPFPKYHWKICLQQLQTIPCLNLDLPYKEQHPEQPEKKTKKCGKKENLSYFLVKKIINIHNWKKTSWGLLLWDRKGYILWDHALFSTVTLNRPVADAEERIWPGHTQGYGIPFSGNSILLPLSAHGTLKTIVHLIAAT